mmetsp:Transcript_34028/g.47153  ORF Transcript_34028/g.47153 Transcript_34028/m.47153 type:complete len:678 (+) Transcript_34028:128-2161(+)
MTDAQIIVDKLNSEPFNYDLNMVSLSEKEPIELLQLLSDVFAHVAQHERTDVRSEGPEAMTMRLMEFLRILKFPLTMDLLTMRTGISEGEQSVVYPVLRWVLPQLEMLKKRAFVGYYLSPVPLPEELKHDEEVQELHITIEELKGEFINLHKEIEGLRKDAKDPNSMKQSNLSLEEEKEQLNAKISSTKAKVHQRVEGAELATLQELSTALRKQQEEELELQSTMRREKERLEAAESKYQRSNTRMREIRANMQDGSAGSILSQLIEETNQNRFRYQEKIPKEIQKKKERLLAAQKVLAEPVNTEADLQRLSRQREMLDTEVKALVDRQARTKHAQGDKTDLQLSQQTSFAKQVAKKKEDVMAKLEKLQEKKRTLLGKYGGDDMGMGGGMGATMGDPGMNNDDMKSKFESVKGKLSTYKLLKKEMDDLQTEELVLSRTEAVLGEKDRVVSASVGMLEAKKGVAGFSETAANLEMVSAAKGEIDEAKGQTLEEISKFVSEINQVIKDRKSKLAPQIKDLRAVRQKFQELETDHSDKKKVYDTAAMGYESKKSKLDSEVKELLSGYTSDQSKYHWLNCMGNVVDVSIKRVTAGLDSHALRDRYSKKVTQQEDLTKKLKSRQKTVKEAAEPNKNQMGMLRDLHKLLHIKIACHRKGNVGSIMHTPAKFETTSGGANVMLL